MSCLDAASPPPTTTPVCLLLPCSLFVFPPFYHLPFLAAISGELTNGYGTEEEKSQVSWKERLTRRVCGTCTGELFNLLPLRRRDHATHKEVLTCWRTDQEQMYPCGSPYTLRLQENRRQTGSRIRRERQSRGGIQPTRERRTGHIKQKDLGISMIKKRILSPPSISGQYVSVCIQSERTYTAVWTGKTPSRVGISSSSSGQPQENVEENVESYRSRDCSLASSVLFWH